MPTSILDSTKKALGLDSDYTAFDPELIMHINSVFSTLQQLAVGPSVAFFIIDKEANWEDFLEGTVNLNAVQSYMYLRVRLLWDPPATSFAITAFEKQAEQLEFRLNVQAEGTV